MMLRNRSRAVTSKPAALTADQTSMLSPTRTFSCSPISSFLGSPRLFNGYFAKHLSDSETVVSSPVSILDTKNSSIFVNPFDRNSIPSPDNRKTAIGLALIGSIVKENKDELFDVKTINRMELNSKLKVQIPVANSPPPTTHHPSVSPTDSPKSPAEFGIKTRSPQLASPLSRSRDLIRQLSLKEMELCEDYTCVITHGPVPKTRHIFDEHIVEGCCGDDDHLFHEESKLEESNSEAAKTQSCHYCKHTLYADREIYMHRGKEGFRSHQCWLKGTKNEEDVAGTSY